MARTTRSACKVSPPFRTSLRPRPAGAMSTTSSSIRSNLDPARSGQGLSLPEQEVLEIVAIDPAGHELFAQVRQREFREVGAIAEPVHEVRRQVRERGHIAGDDVEEMFRTPRPVGDPASQRVLLVDEDDAERVGAQAGEVDGGERAAESATDDRHCLHGSRTPMRIRSPTTAPALRAPTPAEARPVPRISSPGRPSSPRPQDLPTGSSRPSTIPRPGSGVKGQRRLLAEHHRAEGRRGWSLPSPSEWTDAAGTSGRPGRSEVFRPG